MSIPVLSRSAAKQVSFFERDWREFSSGFEIWQAGGLGKPAPVVHRGWPIEMATVAHYGAFVLMAQNYREEERLAIKRAGASLKQFLGCAGAADSADLSQPFQRAAGVVLETTGLFYAPETQGVDELIVDHNFLLWDRDTLELVIFGLRDLGSELAQPNQIQVVDATVRHVLAKARPRIRLERPGVLETELITWLPEAFWWRKPNDNPEVPTT